MYPHLKFGSRSVVAPAIAGGLGTEDEVYKRFLDNITLSGPIVRGWYRAIFTSRLTIFFRRNTLPVPTFLSAHTAMESRSRAAGRVTSRLRQLVGGTSRQSLRLPASVTFWWTGVPQFFLTKIKPSACGSRYPAVLPSQGLLLIPFLHLQWPGYDGWGAQVSIVSPG